MNQNNDFIARVKNLFGRKWSRENQPSKEEKQAARSIRRSIQKDAASSALASAILALTAQYVGRYTSEQVKEVLAGRMAQYERGEVSSLEVVAQCASMIAAYDNEEIERAAPPLPTAPTG